MSKRKRNYAQRASTNPDFVDPQLKEVYEKTPTGGEVQVTRYSDGSSTVHFGGPCGPQNYNEFGEEC